MKGESTIELDKSLAENVSMILHPSEIVWNSVLVALLASSFFWLSTSAWMVFTIGLPAVLMGCGGLGGIVFVALGAKGTLCAYRLLVATKDIEVLKRLRTYKHTDNVLDKR